MKKKSILAFLLLLILFHSVCNWYILSRHRTPLYGDTAPYLHSSLKVNTLLERGHVRDALEVFGKFGPFIFYVSQPFLFLLGRSLPAALVLNDLFLGLLLLGVFLLGKELFSEKTGLLSAFLISFYPGVFGQTRVYLMDFPMAAFVCLDLYLLLRTRHFEDRRFSSLLGLSMGLSALTKPQFIVYLLGPLIVVLLSRGSLSLHDSRMKERIRNLLLVVLVSAGLYSLWLFKSPYLTLKEPTWSIPARATSVEAWMSNTVFYLNQMAEYQLLYIFGILFFCAFVCLLVSRSHARETKLLLVSFIAVPYLFFTFIVRYNKDPRFILPLAICAALVSSELIISFRRNSLKKAAIVCCVIVAIAQFFLLSFAPGTVCSESPLLERYFQAFRRHPDPFNQGWNSGIFHFSDNSYGVDEVFAILNNDLSDRTRVHTISVSSPFYGFMYIYADRLSDDTGGTRGKLLEFCCELNIVPSLNSSPDYFLMVNSPLENDAWTVPQGTIELESHAGEYVLLDSVNISLVSQACPAEASDPLTQATVDIYKRKAERD